MLVNKYIRSKLFTKIKTARYSNQINVEYATNNPVIPIQPVNTYIPHSYCDSCGTYFVHLEWPRVCNCCKKETYLNPIPVGVGMLPVELKGIVGLLLVKRAIKPFIGEYAFPGGFVNEGESWQKAISRELFEETNIETDPAEFILNDAHSTPDGRRILIFGYTKKIRTLKDIYDFIPNSEVLDLVVGDHETKLCFSLHQTVFDNFLANKDTYLRE